LRKLEDILTHIDFKTIQKGGSEEITTVEFDSRKVVDGSLFAAIKGTQADGHNFIEKAIELGAKTIVFEDTPSVLKPEITYLQVEDTSKAFAKIASSYFGNPSEKLKLIGVTGTNGKTTIATLLHHLFTSLSYKSGLLSTIRLKIGEKVLPATHTTPDALQINANLSKMVEAGCEYAFMEVSSHAIDQNRIAGLEFNGGIFTNITHDHLDYHKTFDNYLKAKKKFFDSLEKNTFAISNADDKNGQVMLQNTKAAKKYYSLKNPSDYKAKIIESDFNGLQLQLEGLDFFTPKVGNFNAYNLLAVYATAIELGADKFRVLEILSQPATVEGRFEILKNKNEVFGILDYAHTPDALDNVLKTIYNVNAKKAQIICVFGCGGNRDKTKRPEMAAIAEKWSDQIIITSDNPRNEDPHDIIEDIEKGLTKAGKAKSLTIENREQAIKTACKLANPKDIILVAGKGHEKYQEIKGVKYDFDDKKFLEKYLKEQE
jgi:UDP-N-acetylmuramoyl-L-alanyl-D-glutamate--2,6-diaminopimelate ligase